MVKMIYIYIYDVTVHMDYSPLQLVRYEKRNLVIRIVYFLKEILIRISLNVS